MEVLRDLREHLESSCGPLGVSWRHVGSCLEPSSAVLSHLEGHLGASEALLEPSWAKKDPLPPRGPRQKKLREGRGRVPLPEGKRVLEEERKISLDHLRPEGWWDSTPLQPQRSCLSSQESAKSHQPSGRRWSREFPLPTPFFPFGEGFTPPPTPSPGPGRGAPRWVRGSLFAQDGSKMASESLR